MCGECVPKGCDLTSCAFEAASSRRQFRMQNLPETPSAQESSPSDRLPTASQHDVMLQLVIILGGLRRLDNWPDSSKWRSARKAPETNLGQWRTSAASTQESSNKVTSCTNWFLLAVNPLPQQPQISGIILTQADWRAVRAAARCELGLLLVLHTAETGARVFW